jgi:hypothetical protein
MRIIITGNIIDNKKTSICILARLMTKGRFLRLLFVFVLILKLLDGFVFTLPRIDNFGDNWLSGIDF